MNTHIKNPLLYNFVITHFYCNKAISNYVDHTYFTICPSFADFKKKYHLQWFHFYLSTEIKKSSWKKYALAFCIIYLMSSLFSSFISFLQAKYPKYNMYKMACTGTRKWKIIHGIYTYKGAFFNYVDKRRWVGIVNSYKVENVNVMV